MSRSLISIRVAYIPSIEQNVTIQSSAVTVNDLKNAPSLLNASYLVNALSAEKFVLNGPL